MPTKLETSAKCVNDDGKAKKDVKTAETDDAGSLVQHLLNLLADADLLNSLTLARQLNIDHQRIVGAIKSLQTMEDVSLFVLFLISNSLFCKDDHRNTIE
jgi:hypothetical protein